MTALEDKLWGEREALSKEAREIREVLGLKSDATHSLVMESIRWFIERGHLPIPDGEDEDIDPEFDFMLGSEVDADLTEPPGEGSDLPRSASMPVPEDSDLADLREQLADARATADLLRAELDATMAEQPRDPGQVSLFDEPDAAQQKRPRLSLVPTDDPPLELAPNAILEAVSQVPGVEQVSVDSLPDRPDVFVVSVRGGDDQDIARAILRAIPQGSVRTAGNTRIEVDGDVVCIGRAKPTEPA